MLPPGMYAPTNAQATLHTYKALWAMLLPMTVHGRVSDIWRGYFAERSAFSPLRYDVVEEEEEEDADDTPAPSRAPVIVA